ncbi:MAG: hypothetical protein JNN09_05835 [Alphaproteobacteria bacterium]|nr:hypothetical protein [Alphaproteobacteria bacterium]
MKRALSLAVLCLSLSACATMVDGSSQPVKFEAVGATNVTCEATSGGNEMKYFIRVPQTVWIKKSAKTLHLDCMAPGNREKSFDVEPHGNPTTALNILNGSLGLLYDVETGAKNLYPEVVTVDFSDTVATPSLLPSYYNTDALNPQDAPVEDMRPFVAQQPGDAALAARHKAAEEEFDRQAALDAQQEAEREARKAAVEGGFYGDKTPKVSEDVTIDSEAKPVAEPKKTSSAQPTSVLSVKKLEEEDGKSSPSASSTPNLSVPSARPLPQPIFPATTSF